MKNKLRSLPGLLLACTVFCTISRAQGPAAGSYHVVKEIAVGSSEGWDYASIDETGRRLYIAHGARIVVIDTDKGEVAGEITGTPGVHGFALAPDLHRGFSSDGAEARVGIVDLGTLRIESKVATGENPDAILYEGANQEIYTFYSKGHSVTVIPVATGEVTATSPLPGKPEFAACNRGRSRVYCHIEDKDVVVAINTKTHQVVNRWPVAPGKEPVSMAIDPSRQHLYLGCRNQQMVTLDTATGRILTSSGIGPGMDATVFDPATQRALCSTGNGIVSIIEEDVTGKLSVVQKLVTTPGARTLAINPKTHNIYLPAGGAHGFKVLVCAI